MGLLSQPHFGLVSDSIRRQVIATVILPDKVADLLESFLSDHRGIGSVVGDQTGFVERLSGAHRSLSRKSQHIHPGLLESGGSVGRIGMASSFRLFSSRDQIFLFFEFRGDPVGIFLAANRNLYPVLFEKFRFEISAVAQFSKDFPVFFGVKGLALLLSINHQPHRYRLHSPRRKTVPDLLPKERGKFVAHQPIQNPPGLLGIHELLVNFPRRKERLLHRFFRDFMESDPFGFVVPDQLFDVPGDRLPLPIRVSGEKNLLGCGRRFFQLRDDLFFPRNLVVLGGKIVLHIHSQILFGKVHQMSLGGEHFIPLPQELLESFCFCRGFNDYQLHLRR